MFGVHGTSDATGIHSFKVRLPSPKSVAVGCGESWMEDLRNAE